LSQLTAETISWRHIWQLSMYTLEPPICIPKHCRRSAIPGQHAIYFRKSRILSNAVPLGCYFGGFTSTAGYVPATRLRIASERLGFPLVFTPEVATRFYPGAQESLAAFSSKPFGFDTGRHRNNSRLSSLSPTRYRVFAVPVSVIETREPRDREVYTAGHFFRQTFMCFIFLVSDSKSPIVRKAVFRPDFGLRLSFTVGYC